MDFISRSDIFFFITSIAVIIVTVLFAVAAFYVIRTLRNFYEISDSLNKTVGDIGEKIKNVKEWTKNNPLLGLIFGGFAGRKKRKNKKTHE